MKKLLSILLVSGTISLMSTTLVSCNIASKERNNDASKERNNNLDDFQLSNIDLNKGLTSKEDVIIAIENQIANYSNISFDKIKNDNRWDSKAEKGLAIWVQQGDIRDENLFTNSDSKEKLESKMILGYWNVGIGLGINGDDLFKMNKSFTKKISVTSSSSMINLSKFNLRNIVCYEDSHTNNDLLNNINEQIAKYINDDNVDFAYLSRDVNYKYTAIESDGSEFDESNISQNYSHIAEDGKMSVEISFQNDLYVNDFHKTFNINLSFKKHSLANFKLSNIQLGNDWDKLQDVLDNVYLQLSNDDMSASDLEADDNIILNFKLIQNNGQTIQFDKNSDDKIISKLAFSGKLQVNITVKSGSKFFDHINNKKLEVDLTTPARPKYDLSKFNLCEINLNKNEAMNYEIIENIEQKISYVSNVDLDNLENDNNLNIEITESDGTNFSTSTLDPNIMKRSPVSGETKVSISVPKDDDYLKLDKPLTFYTNLNILKKQSLDSLKFNDINLTEKQHSQFDLLNNIEKQLSDYTKINLKDLKNNINNNHDIYIKITTSDGDSINTKEQSVITKNSPKGAIKILLSVNSNDKYFANLTDKTFNVNLDY